QQAITAVGGAQQNPCGSNTASLFFVTQQDFGECADQGASTAVPAGSTAAGNASGRGLDQTASQQTITLVGGAQQNPCGSNTASLLFVTQQDFGECADQGTSTAVPAGSEGTGQPAPSGEIASQQAITLLGGAQQNPCGSSTFSLLFVTQQDFGTCGTSGGPPPGDESNLAISSPTVNGEPAATAPGPEVTAGQSADVVVTATNNGTTTISNISGTSSTGSLTCAQTSLAAGQSTTCTMSTTAVEGVQVVSVTVTGIDESGASMTDDGNVYYTGTNEPGNGEVGVSITDVTVNGDPADTAPGPETTLGDPVDVSVTVTNSGDTDIEQLNSSGDLTCEANSLAPDESTQCGVELTPDEAGQYQVQVTITATGPNGSTGTADSTAYFQVTNEPTQQGELTVESTMVNGEPAGSAPGAAVDTGDDVQVDIQIENTGEAPLTEVSGTSSQGPLTCSMSDLDPGDSATCTVTTTAQDGAQEININVTGTNPDGDDVTDSTTAYYTGETGP
ncbi:MAG: hypothetical protein ACRDMV_04300, partial [Streptosporangiales bacterium]